VPNFQNPTGITYSEEKRRAVADLMNDLGGVFIEDDPYGELRFKGQDIPSMKKFLGDRAIVLGTFSKVVSPEWACWICASQEIMEKLLVAKQASDLHSSCFVQRIVHRYLIENDMDGHIAMIKQMYGKQRDAMVQAMEDLFPGNVQFTRPEGGMFLWVTLPEKLSSMKLFDMAIKEKVAFVPGQAFFVDGGGANTMRLNYSNSDEEKIVEGIGRMAKALRTMI
jgi:2-aminoadipate transaminase